MTKVIKGEFEKIKDVKVEDVSLTCDTPLEVFNNEIRGDDEVELTDEESPDDMDEVAEVFRIDTNLFESKLQKSSPWHSKNLTIFYKSIQTYLLRTLRDSRPMKITRMIRSMNGTRTYHGSMRSHGLTLEFRPNPHQLNILASLSTIRLDVRNGQHVVGRMMDTVMEETYQELTLLKTNSIIRITNAMRLWKKVN
ncbi:hypothetical protein Tco_1277311 [Tanacetum coccineum]